MARKLNRGVAIVGAGMSKFGAFPDKNSRELLVEAFIEMMGSIDKGIDPKDIEAFYFGDAAGEAFEGQGHTAPIMGDWLGLLPIPCVRVENACASGSVAIRQAMLSIASGMHDIVLAGGAEKMSNLSTTRVTDTLADFTDVYSERSAGFTFPTAYASMATAYMAEYGARPEHFMMVGIKNHRNGALNPKAQFNSSILDIMNSKISKAKGKGGAIPTWKDEMDFLHDEGANPIVAWPMRLFDCSPISDGAACVLVVAEELVRRFTDSPLYIIGSGLASCGPLHDRDRLTSISAARVASQQAYEMAGVKPQDIQVAEVHDCFTIAELVAMEDIGFYEPGTAYKAVEEGATALDGPKPINPSGGLKSKGHPISASGAGQVVEIWHQLREEAGLRQVPIKNLRLGLTHNIGAHGSTCSINIFERR